MEQSGLYGRVRQELRLRNFRPHTITAYLRSLRAFGKNAMHLLQRMSVLAICCTLVFPCSSVFSQWIPQPVPSGISFLSSVAFSSSQQGIASGYTLESSLSGRVVYTSNGGETWYSAQLPDSTLAIPSVQTFPGGRSYAVGHSYDSSTQHTVRKVSRTTGFTGTLTTRAEYLRGIVQGGMTGTRGTFFRSTNYGETWSNWGNVPAEIEYLVDLHFFNPDSGFVVALGSWPGEHPSILRTTDGGITWTSATDPDSMTILRSIHFGNASVGLSVGYQYLNQITSGLILRTTDGGATWERTVIPQVDNFTGVAFTDDSTAYVSGILATMNGVVYTTTNAGADWQSVDIPGDSLLLEGICFAPNTTTGIVCGERIAQGEFLPFASRTTDGGLSWTPATIPDLPDSSALVGGWLLDEETGYLVGGNVYTQATILHSTNGGVTSVVEEADAVADQFDLSQNYPNPFNPSTSIVFSIPQTSDVDLRMFNILGEEVGTLVSRVLDAGRYRVRWDASGVPGGVYLCRLQAGSFTEMKKLLLLR